MKRGSVSSMAIGLLIVGLLVGAAGGYFVSTSSIQPQIDDLETQVSSLNSEKAILDTEVSALEVEIPDLVSQVSGLNTQVVKLNSEKSSIEAQLSTAQAKIDEKENEISSLQGTVAEYEAQIDDLETQLDMKDMRDSDGDGVPDLLEVNGYYYKDGEFWLWDGDPNITYYCTDPNQPSTDQDPYSDGMEVSGVKMDTSVVEPGDHPLVPAYPDIYMSLGGFSVAPKKDITISGGGTQTKEWYNSVTGETHIEHNWQVEGSISHKWALNSETELKITVTGGEKWGNKQTVSNSESVLSSRDWNEATTVDPSNAAKLKLNLIFENRGTATAHNIRPTINIKLGGHPIFTYTFPDNKIINKLAVDDEYLETVGETSEEWEGFQEIKLTLDELKLIQQGVPIFLDITQSDADVVKMSEEGQWDEVDTWDNYEARIDGVCARISVDLGDGNMKDYRVYADRARGPVVTLREALEWTVGCEETSSGVEIMGETVGDWRIGFSQNAFDDVVEQLAERNILDVVLDDGWTIIIKAPTGLDTPQIVWFDSYSDYKTTLVKAAVVDDYAVSKVLFKASPEAEGQEMVTQKNYTSVYSLALPSDYKVTGEEIIEATNDRNNSITALVEVARKAPIADGFYVITSVNSNKVLDIEGTIEEGRNVIQYNFAGIDTQEWYVQHVSHGYYRIMDKTGEMCLEVVEGGVNVQINNLQNNDNQRWALEAVGDGSYVIIASHSGKCLDIHGSSKDNQASAIQNTGSDSTSQRWIVQPADSYPEIMPIKGTQDEHFIISNKESGACLKVRGQSTDDGAEVVHKTWIGRDNQQWELIPVGDGYFRICAKHSDLCLTIVNYSAIQKTYLNDDNQKWLIKRHEAVDSYPGDFYYEIENKESLMCLTSNETDIKVNQQVYTGGDNQKWLLIPVDQVKVQIKITAVSFQLLEENDRPADPLFTGKELEMLYVGLQYSAYYADGSVIVPWKFVYGKPLNRLKWSKEDDLIEAENENTRKFTVYSPRVHRESQNKFEEVYIIVRARFGELDAPADGTTDDWWWTEQQTYYGSEFFIDKGLHSFVDKGCDGTIKVTFRLERITYP